MGVWQRSAVDQPCPLVLDGGLASELERLGCDVSGPLWSARVLADRPEAIEEVHTAYLEAGADCITTASYQVSFEGFAEVGLSASDAATALRKSVDLAEASRRKITAAGRRRPLIAASVGPFGAVLHDGSEYHGQYGCSFTDLVRFHRARLAVLATTAADLLACETIPSLEEAEALVAALREFPQLRGWISFSCGDNRHTCHGELIAECATRLDREPQVVAIGVNCTAPQLAGRLISEIRGSTTKSIVVYPNTGRVWNAVARQWSGAATAFDFGVAAVEWYRSGASWIGGCCGTTPAHIRGMRKALAAAS